MLDLGRQWRMRIVVDGIVICSPIHSSREWLLWSLNPETHRFRLPGPEDIKPLEKELLRLPVLTESFPVGPYTLTDFFENGVAALIRQDEERSSYVEGNYGKTVSRNERQRRGDKHSNSEDDEESGPISTKTLDMLESFRREIRAQGRRMEELERSGMTREEATLSIFSSARVPIKKQRHNKNPDGNKGSNKNKSTTHKKSTRGSGSKSRNREAQRTKKSNRGGGVRNADGHHVGDKNKMSNALTVEGVALEDGHQERMATSGQVTSSSTSSSSALASSMAPLGLPPQKHFGTSQQHQTLLDQAMVHGDQEMVNNGGSTSTAALEEQLLEEDNDEDDMYRLLARIGHDMGNETLATLLQDGDIDPFDWATAEQQVNSLVATPRVITKFINHHMFDHHWPQGGLVDMNVNAVHDSVAHEGQGGGVHDQ
ncbi:unnamed protein product [Amoebophrya sp. A25]|nr:unnamed protein product [Amoebophrya sp. A25]|eukprot:GSA25T00023482001.1